MTRRRVRRKIGGAVAYRPWKDWEVNERITGKLTAIDEDTYGKPSYKIEIEEMNFEHTPAKEEHLAAKVGGVIALNACGSLDYKMKEVEIGDVVEVTYEGVDVLPENHKFKGKEVHQVDVVLLEEEDADGSDEDLSDL